MTDYEILILGMVIGSYLTLFILLYFAFLGGKNE